MPVDVELIESIRRVEQDVRESQAKVKRLRADAVEEVEQFQEYQDVEDLTAKLREARAKLKAALQDDRLNEELEAETAKLKDLREILSHHLMRYRETSQTTYLEEEESSKVRPILVTAKLGKPEYHQEEMKLDLPDHPMGHQRVYELSKGGSNKKIVIDKDGMRTEAPHANT